MIDTMSNYTLLPLTNSWWNAANVPGKKVQMLTHPGGIQMYEAQCRETLKDWKGFTVVYGENGVAEKESKFVSTEKDAFKEPNLPPQASAIPVRSGL